MSSRPITAAALLAAIAIAGCSTAVRHPVSDRVQPVDAGGAILTPAAQAAADSGRPAYTRADVRFMQGMIRHHAQALVMADWAQTRAARNAVKILAARIDVAQRDEIATMQRWLRDRREIVPDVPAVHDMTGHHTQAGDMMPGMLTHDQLMQLEKATGAEFDRLFLTFMIQHHEGALTMVRELFSSPGAGQDATIFRFASDVEADQTTEIDRMRTMLAPQPNQP
jgi:uncharacterized protein (DUF305 family)